MSDPLHFKDATAANPCPICQRKKDCQHTDEGPVLCRWAAVKGGGVPIEAPPGWTRSKKASKDGAWFYHPVTGDGRRLRRVLSAEEIAAREKRDREYTEWRTREGRAMWRSATPDAPEIASYLTGRGLDVAALPPTLLSRSLRFHAAAKDKKDRIVNGRKAWRVSPAMIACVLGPELVEEGGQSLKLNWVGVHVTYLERDDLGAWRKRREPAERVKQKWGPFKARAIRLCEEFPRGVLIIAEGIETALACHQATGLAAWAAGDAQNLIDLVLPAWLIAPGPAAQIGTIIIGADRDGKQASPPGQIKAIKAAEAMRAKFPWLDVRVRAPQAGDFPELVETIDGDDWPIAGGKSVDWLDVLVRCGADRTREGLAGGIDADGNLAKARGHPVIEGFEGGGVDNAAGSGGGGGETAAAGESPSGRPLIPASRIERVERFLEQRRVPPACPGERWTHAYYRGRHWRWTGAHYDEIPEDADAAVVNEVHRWMDRHDAIKVVKGEEKQVRFVPSAHAAKEMEGVLRGETFIAGDDMPMWLAPTFTKQGFPRHGLSHWDRVVRDHAAAGLPDPRHVIAFRNGLLDGEKWLDGEIEFMPHSPRYFARASLPFDLPVEMIRKADRKGELAGLVDRLAPDWRQCKMELVGGDPVAADLIAEMAGYYLTYLRIFKRGNLFIVTGPGDGGKSVLLRVFERLNEGAYVATSVEQMCQTFHFHSWIGKRLAGLDEVDASSFRLPGSIVEIVKRITGGAAFTVNRKNLDELTNVHLPTRIMMLANAIPDFRDPSGALLNRVILLEVGRDRSLPMIPQFEERLYAQLPGIMLDALIGMRRLFKRGGFIQPESGQRALDVFAASMSLHQTFMDDVLVYVPPEKWRKTQRGDAIPVWTPTEEIYKAWCTWLEQRGGANAGNDATLMRLLRPLFKRAGWVAAVESPVEDPFDEGSRKRGYLGVQVSQAALATPYADDEASKSRQSRLY